MGRERRERFSLLQRVLAPAINKPRKNAQRRKRHGEPGLTGKTDVPASDSLQMVIDCFADELVVVGSDFRVHQVNSAVTRRLGKPAEDIIGQFCYQVNHGAEEPCQPPWCECPLNHVMETGKPARVVHTHKEGQADGGERWVEIMVSPVCNGGGQITGVLELVRDISKDRKLKKEVLRANRELLAVNSTARALNQSLDLKATLQAAAEGLLEALEAQLSWIQLSDDDGKLPTAWASELPEEVSDELMEIISNMRSSKETATSASYSIIPGGAELNQTLWQFIVTPLQSKGVVWGKAGVATARRPVDQQRIQLLDASGHQIAAAIERCKLYEEVQAGRDTLGKLLHRIITTQEEERRRIARELHDETGQALFVLRLSLERLALTPSTSKDEMKSRLEQSLRLCQQADEEVD
ncbi:MAG: PAS domain-containing protein, partial [Dehalococcoidia bacterium]|nr:PAS domain-containing protein [Dehalococcoidia bacterium]